MMSYRPIKFRGAGQHMILASAGIGGSAGGLVLLIVAGIVLAAFTVSILAFFRGIDWCLEKPPIRRRLGVISTITGVLLLPCLFCGPRVLFRLQHATPPIADGPPGLIREGMSREEVEAILGPPHRIESDRPPDVKWTYWRDAIRLNCFSVMFGEDGRVRMAGGD
jgi:hypothetical protein